MAERILVIDDEVLNLKMAEHILKREFEVVSASSGEQGLAILKEKPVDLVLIDLDMPQMGGLEILSAIREDAELAETKVVILTSAGYREDVTEAVRLGALDFIRKPFFPTELMTRIKKALKWQRKDNILVVDDDRMNLMLAKKMLEIKYNVVCVRSGEEALSYLEHKVPDLVLLDLHMPGLNGLEVFQRIKEMDGVKDIPVIFLTADSEQETEITIFKAGAMDYIQKPFLAEVVIRRIDRILELYHFQQSLQDEVDKKTQKLQESNRKVMNLSTQVMLTLANTIEVKDKYTKGHSMRVAEYSREIARRLGKSETEMNNIYYIALLHDIGKIGISDEIINKPGKLSDDEYKVIKSHPVLGADILKDMSEMPEAAIGAHWHHERYDGKGYPDGLAGEEIPEIARIIGVADAYDAMSSKRSYRDILSQDTIKKELLEGMGNQFDPEIVVVMLEMIHEDTNYNMRG
jgi:putative two-component system response regulator